MSATVHTLPVHRDIRQRYTDPTPAPTEPMPLRHWHIENQLAVLHHTYPADRVADFFATTAGLRVAVAEYLIGDYLDASDEYADALSLISAVPAHVALDRLSDALYALDKAVRGAA